MEVRRVLLGKTFLLTLAALVALNAFFFVYSQSRGQGDFRAYGDAYHRKVEELSALSWEEGRNRCIEIREDALELMLADEWEYSAENSRQLQIAEQLESQYDHLLSYEGYLDKIDADVAKLQRVSLFSDPDSRAYKNTVKTAADFAKMRSVTLTAGHDLAVTEVFADSWADYSVVILMCVVCGLFASERKEGLWPMICAAPGGRKKLACRRVGILFAASWIATLAVVGSRIALCGWVFHGLGEWDRAIQSISIFQNVPTPMTLGQFWALYMTVKALGAFWVGLVLWAVLSAIANLGLALGAIGLVIGAEYACTAIPLNSMFAVLRYVNVFSYVDYRAVFAKYYNILFFGGLISGGYLVIVILVPLCVGFSVLNIWLAEMKRPVAPVNRLLRWMDGVTRRLDPWLNRGGLLRRELKKLYIRRMGVLLVAVMAFALYHAAPPNREYDPLNIYMDYYQEKYAGVITQDTIDGLYSEFVKAQETEQFRALNVLISEAESAPEGAWMIPTAPYDAIWNRNYGNYHRSTALTALLFLVLLLSPIASQEHQSGMTTLLRTAPGGRRRLMLCKQVVLALTTVLVWAAVYGTELWNAVYYHGSFRCLEAPAYSLSQFREMGLEMPILWVMVLYYLAKLAVMLAAGELCLLLSTRCEKNRDAVLLCCGVLLIPAGLAAIGSEIGASVSFLLPLGGVELFLP